MGQHGHELVLLLADRALLLRDQLGALQGALGLALLPLQDMAPVLDHQQDQEGGDQAVRLHHVERRLVPRDQAQAGEGGQAQHRDEGEVEGDHHRPRQRRARAAGTRMPARGGPGRDQEKHRDQQDLQHVDPQHPGRHPRQDGQLEGLQAQDQQLHPAQPGPWTELPLQADVEEDGGGGGRDAEQAGAQVQGVGRPGLGPEDAAVAQGGDRKEYRAGLHDAKGAHQGVAGEQPGGHAPDRQQEDGGQVDGEDHLLAAQHPVEVVQVHGLHVHLAGAGGGDPHPDVARPVAQGDGDQKVMPAELGLRRVVLVAAHAHGLPGRQGVEDLDVVQIDRTEPQQQSIGVRVRMDQCVVDRVDGQA